jgi:hypothetical protein
MPDEVVDTALPAPDDEAAIAAEVETLTQSPADQQADRIKGALIAAKRGEKAALKRIKELEPVVARTQDIERQLASAQPVINAILSDPKLNAAAMRIASGTHASAESTDQPTDDADAAGYAEDMGWYLQDGSVDTARGRRVLNRVAKVSRGQAEDVVRPLAGVTLNTRAESNLSRILAMTDDNGVPWATEESIRAVAAQLPANLLADEKVVHMVLRNAIGEDRISRRTPKAPEEPLYLASAGSGRRVAPSVTSEERAALAKVGLTEEDLKRTQQKVDKAGGKSVVFGS